MNPRALQLVVLGAALAGLGISIYLTAVHSAAAPLVCGARGLVNCEQVLASAYASIAGSAVPTSAAGILWFGLSGALAAVRLAGAGSDRLQRVQLAWAAAGLLTVLYLVFVEIDVLGAICAWCTAAHALVLLTFLATLTLAAAGGREPAPR